MTEPERHPLAKELLSRGSYLISITSLVVVAGGVWDMRGNLETRLGELGDDMGQRLAGQRLEMEKTLSDFKSEMRNDMMQVQNDVRQNSASVNHLSSSVSAMEAKVEFLLAERRNGQGASPNPR